MGPRRFRVAAAELSVPCAPALAHRLAVFEPAHPRRPRDQAQPPGNESQQSVRACECYQRSSFSPDFARAILVSPQIGRLRLHPAEKADPTVRLCECVSCSPSHHRRESEKRYPVSYLRHWQRRQPGAHWHPSPSRHPIRSPVCWMLRRLAFRDWMGASNWKLARSGGSNSPCRDISERSPAAHRHHQRPRPSARDVALGARSRQNEPTREGICDSLWHQKRVSGRSSHPQRRGLDFGLLGLNRSSR